MFFSGGNWSPGQVYGHRAFNVYSNALTSPIQMSFIWKDGTNISECTFCDSKRQPGCSCGFYAYYNHKDQNVQGQVYGIIRGHGMVDKGELGFKAEKAEIVALCAPGYHPDKTKKTWSTNKVRNLATLFGILWVAFATLTSVTIMSLPVLGSIMVVLSVVNLFAYVKTLQFLDKLTNARSGADINWAKLLSHYPSVEIFDNHDAMVKAYKTKMENNKLGV